MKNLLLTLLFVIASICAIAQQPAKPEAKPALKITYIRAGHLFDATDDKMRDNMVIVVQDERIQSVGAAASVSIPSSATVIDLSRATVLPGLIDCHTHLGFRADRYNEMRVAVNQAGQHRGSRKIDDRCA